MKRKNGFTLVELLAVIVILAIIVLIATPMILNVINNAKKGASESSALGYIEGIEKYIVLNELTKENDFSFEKEKGYEVEYIKDIIQIKGDKPTEGWVCIGSKKEIEKAKLKINNYVIKYEDNKATVVDEEIGEMDCSAGDVNTPLTYQAYKTGTKDEVSTIYYNPEQASFCTETDYNNNTDKLGKTGCLKWYAIENSDSSKATVDVILDHNTTATVAWNSTGSNSEMVQVQSSLTSDITTWNDDVKKNARLIEANEVAAITKNDTFETSPDMFYLENNNTKVPTEYSGKYSWLYDYTYGCRSYGCTIEASNTSGYWTSTRLFTENNTSWHIYREGTLNGIVVNRADLLGVRPVITITKSIND